MAKITKVLKTALQIVGISILLLPPLFNLPYVVGLITLVDPFGQLYQVMKRLVEPSLKRVPGK